MSAVVDFAARVSGPADEGDDWPDPIAFDAFDVPDFPIESLPPWAKRWCEEEATALQVPIDLPAMLVLAVVSLCIAKKIAVQVKPGWVEPTNLYTAIALGPGEGKSPVFGHATLALRQWESEQRDRLAPQIAAAQEGRKLLEERVKSARLRATRGDGTPAQRNAEDEAREFAVELSELRVPALPRLIADDATPEAVGRLLGEQGGRLGIFSSEGGPLAILAGRYSAGRANLELFCKAYSGDHYTLDRVGRSSICLDAPLLTIALTVQPSVIAGLASTPEMRGQGLLARFLYVMPLSMVGRRLADPEPVSAEAFAGYGAAVRRLLDLDARTDDRGELTTRYVTLAPDARAALIAFKERLEPRLGPGDDLDTLADWGNKLAGTVARLACALHVAEHTDDGDLWSPISHAVMQRAISIGEYAIPHACAAFGVMGSDPATEQAKRAWAWIAKRSETTVSKRDLHRALHAKSAADLDAPIAALVERGYLRERAPTATGGRPSAVYAINPRAKRGQK